MTDAKTELPLTPKMRQALKARAHALNPVVLLGQAGLSPSVLKEIDRALCAHELIKVRIPSDDAQERKAIYSAVANQLGAARIQSIGKVVVLFRPAPESQAKTAGPNKRKAAPRVPSKTAARLNPARKPPSRRR